MAILWKEVILIEEGRGAMKPIGILLHNRVISGAGTAYSSGTPEFTHPQFLVWFM